MNTAPHLATEGCRQLGSPYSAAVACPRCAGHGALPLNPRDYSGTYTIPPRCDACCGTGRNDQ